MAKILSAFITLYQAAISPFLGRNCRFHPTCSEYAKQALEQHGAAKGGYLAVRRIIKCHPFHEGGYDPVPGDHSACSHLSGDYLSNNHGQAVESQTCFHTHHQKES